MNPKLSGIAPSLIRALNSRKQPGDIDLGLGEPLLAPDREALVEAATWMADNGCKYGPNAGEPELRSAIARYLALPDLDQPENVCVTCGSQEAIFLAIKALCDPGRHELLVCEPTYPLYRKIAQMEGLANRAVGMSERTGFAFEADPLLAAVSERTRLIVLCSPCNPTGKVAALTELERLASGLSRLPDPPFVLVDEAYREILLGDAPMAQLAALHPRTVVAGSLSKSNALTGLRLGWLLGPAAVVAAATKIHQFVLTSASALSQRVALALIAGDRLGAHRQHYRDQWQAYKAALDRHELPYEAPDGGFYAMVKLPPALAGDSVQAAFDLQARGGVVAIPGAAFGPTAEGWLRTSFVAAPEQLAEGAARMARFFQTADAQARP